MDNIWKKVKSVWYNYVGCGNYITKIITCISMTDNKAHVVVLVLAIQWSWMTRILNCNHGNWSRKSSPLHTVNGNFFFYTGAWSYYLWQCSARFQFCITTCLVISPLLHYRKRNQNNDWKHLKKHNNQFFSQYACVSSLICRGFSKK